MLNSFFENQQLNKIITFPKLEQMPKLLLLLLLFNLLGVHTKTHPFIQ